MRLPIVKIRLKILRYLKKMPMTVYDLSKAIDVSYNAVVKNLEYLKSIGKVEKASAAEYNLRTDKQLWRLKR